MVGRRPSADCNVRGNTLPPLIVAAVAVDGRSRSHGPASAIEALWSSWNSSRYGGSPGVRGLGVAASDARGPETAGLYTPCSRQAIRRRTSCLRSTDSVGKLAPLAPQSAGGGGAWPKGWPERGDSALPKGWTSEGGSHGFFLVDASVEPAGRSKPRRFVGAALPARQC